MNKRLSVLALCLLLPVPTLGVLAGMILWPEQAVGKVIFFISKLWILLLPVFWRTVIDRKPLSLSKPRKGGFAVSTILGLLISAIITIAYLALGRLLIDPELIGNMAAETGLGSKGIYLAGAAYWICINSVLEEYVWRWFVVEKCSNLFSRKAAIAISALGFTIHHVFAMQTFFNPLVTAVASAGIWIGGAVWSWCYLRYKSIWPGYLSHAIVDLAIFAIGWYLIFNG